MTFLRDGFWGAEAEAGRSVSFSQPSFPSQFALHPSALCGFISLGFLAMELGANRSRGQAQVVLGHGHLQQLFLHPCRC